MKPNKNILPYFEHQKLISLRCGLYAVNNFLGSRIYTKEQFDQICQQLQTETHQKYQHFFGGDYDITVLIKALQNKNFQVEWHDSRKQFIKHIEDPDQEKRLAGYLVNLKLPEKFYHKFLNISGRHWISIRIVKIPTKQIIYKMDSKIKNPETINQDQLINYLQNERCKNAHILRIFSIPQKKIKL